jgi:hypothetical protein
MPVTPGDSPVRLLLTRFELLYYILLRSSSHKLKLATRRALPKQGLFITVSSGMATHELQQPLLEPSASRWMLKAHPSMRHRAVVLVLISLSALALALLLPTNKNLPCPYCTISSWIGWLYFLAWSVRYE